MMTWPAPSAIGPGARLAGGGIGFPLPDPDPDTRSDPGQPTISWRVGEGPASGGGRVRGRASP